MYAIGAIIFYTSDYSLAINKFCHRITYADDSLIMITYYTAQLFITVANT